MENNKENCLRNKEFEYKSIDLSEDGTENIVHLVNSSQFSKEELTCPTFLDDLMGHITDMETA